MKKVLILPLFIFLSLLSYSQLTTNGNNPNNRNNRNNNRVVQQRFPSLSVGVMVMDPQGTFDVLYPGTPAGIGAQLSFPMGRVPLELVGGFAWYSRGGTTENVDIYEGMDADGDEFFTEGEISVNSNIYSYDMGARFKPFNGVIQPYGEVLVGFQNFITKSTISADDGFSEDVVDHP
ncbi:MAG: hypothetical protein AAF193_11380, partial [Bacteroidota bacterium]